MYIHSVLKLSFHMHFSFLLFLCTTIQSTSFWKMHSEFFLFLQVNILNFVYIRTSQNDFSLIFFLTWSLKFAFNIIPLGGFDFFIILNFNENYKNQLEQFMLINLLCNSFDINFVKSKCVVLDTLLSKISYLQKNGEQ